jgi:hypothetical protein
LGKNQRFFVQTKAIYFVIMVVLLHYIVLAQNEFLIIQLFAGIGGFPDGKISVADLGFVSYHFGTTSTSANWTEVSKADIDRNGVIDIVASTKRS